MENPARFRPRPGTGVGPARRSIATDASSLHLEIDEDFGAYCFYPANYIARVVAMILTGPYRIADYSYEVRVALTNKCGSAPMRAPMAITSRVMEERSTRSPARSISIRSMCAGSTRCAATSFRSPCRPGRCWST